MNIFAFLTLMEELKSLSFRYSRAFQTALQDDSVGRVRFNLKRSPHQVGPISHDFQTDSFRTLGIRNKSNSIILYGESDHAVPLREAHLNQSGLPILDRVTHPFLSDFIEMGGDIIIIDEDGLRTMKSTRNTRKILGAGSQFFKGMHEGASLQLSRIESSRRIPRLIDGPMEQV